MSSQLNYSLSDEQVSELFRQFPEKDLTEIKAVVRDEVDEFIDNKVISSE